MKKLLAMILLTVMVLGLCACGGETAQEPQVFRVGFGRVDITPEQKVNVSLDGYDDRYSVGMLNPVMATCVAITDAGNNTLLLYTLDMCNTEQDTVTKLREKLTASTGIPGDNITISGTHTHSSPAAPYAQNYVDLLVQAGEEALADRAPATIFGGTHDVPNMNFVRHYITKDGSYYGDNFGSSKSGLVSHTTEADQTMRLIRFVREGDKKDVLMVNWQVHPKVASTADSQVAKKTRDMISSDFIGFARDHVEAKEDVLMAYYTGASGNLNPRSRFTAEQALVPEEPKAYGEQFGDHVITALANLQPMETGSVGSKKAPLVEGNERGAQLHAYTVGSSLGFATVPAEIFDTTGNQIREGSPCDITFVITVANGRVTYIPPIEVFGYSATGVTAYEVSVCRSPAGTAESLAKSLGTMLTELAGK